MTGRVHRQLVIDPDPKPPLPILQHSCHPFARKSVRPSQQVCGAIAQEIQAHAIRYPHSAVFPGEHSRDGGRRQPLSIGKGYYRLVVETIYAATRSAVAEDLMNELKKRSDAKAPLAAFDYGYFVEANREAEPLKSEFSTLK